MINFKNFIEINEVFNIMTAQNFKKNEFFVFIFPIKILTFKTIKCRFSMKSQKFHQLSQQR